MIVLDPTVRRTLREHAATAWPGECCGYLLGSPERVCGVHPAANRADDPRSGYRLDPADGLRALRAARARGLEVVGFYHSHPGGAPRPSTRDAAEAIPGSLHAVIPVPGGRAGEPGLWRATGGGFRPVAATERGIDA